MYMVLVIDVNDKINQKMLCAERNQNKLKLQRNNKLDKRRNKSDSKQLQLLLTFCDDIKIRVSLLA